MKNIQFNKENIRNANNNIVYNAYLNEISKFKPLTVEEEVNLFKDIVLTKNQKAIDQIAKHNTLFVVSVAKHYKNFIMQSTLTLEDLISEGNVGLLTAINKFDHTRGFKFISYAVWWIRQSIVAHITKNFKNIKSNAKIFSINSKLLKEQSKLEQILMRDITEYELFESLIESGILKDTEFDKMKLIINCQKFEYSLNYTNDYDVQFIDTLKCDELLADDLIIENEKKVFITNLLNTIPEPIRKYFICFYGLYNTTPLSIKEMSIKYDENKETIRMKLERYKHKMKKSYNLSNSKEYKNINKYDLKARKIEISNDTNLIKQNETYVNKIAPIYNESNTIYLI
jgi:RNA polymerase primary sigma factor